MVDLEPLLGLDVASTTALFLVLLAIHVAAAIVAIVSGVIAMLVRKGAGRHSRAGRCYLVSVVVVFVSACVLASFRWPADLPLVIAGGVSTAAAAYGFFFRRLRCPGDVPHIVAMGFSYIALLTVFYVDNGPHLPVWNLLPPISFWFLPSAVGVPLIIRALWRRRPLAMQKPTK